MRRLCLGLLPLLLILAARSITAQVVRETDAAGRVVVRRCQSTEWPKTLPALDAVVDSAALWAALAAVPATDTSSVLLSIIHRDGGTPAVRLLEPNPASAVAAVLADAASSRLRAMAPPPPAGAVRVRLRGGPEKAVHVERSVYCPPVVVPGWGPVGPERKRVMLGPGERVAAGRRIRIDAQLTIDESGMVSAVDLATTSGIRELDEEMVADLRRRSYRPALLDGLPITSWERTNGRKMRL